MQQTKTIKLEYFITLTYDETSEEFKKALDDFKEVVLSWADADYMLKNIAESLNRRHDYKNMIEGVGYVRYKGRCEDETLWCGVETDTDEPDCYASIED